MQEPALEPSHQVAEENVEVPTIRRMALDREDAPHVYLQWTGVCEGRDIKERQFFFRVDANDRDWLGNPEVFSVIYLGRLLGLPLAEDIRQTMASSWECDQKDVMVVWLSTDRVSSPSAKGEIPISFVARMIPLADPVYCIINPAHFHDDEVRTNAIQRVQELELIRERREEERFARSFEEDLY